MSRYWRRTIDSAQRRVRVERPDPDRPSLTALVFEIQGVHLVTAGDRDEIQAYHALAERGIAEGEARPLTIFERLIRRPSPIGKVAVLADDLLEIRLWTRPPTRIVLDVSNDAGKATWRELEIMVLSAGYVLPRPV